MQNPISISCINDFIFFVFILLQYLSSTTVNYNNYRVKESKLDAMLGGICTFSFNADATEKNKFIIRLLIENMLDRFKHHGKNIFEFSKQKIKNL